MRWLQNYIWKTRFIPLIITINDDGAITCIDGAHTVHADAKGHSGLFNTMGKGAMINVSKKLGIVTNSFTETEIVSTRELMPKCTWFRYFRETQGKTPKEDILMQDNKNGILLQKNWPFSTKKGIQYIHMRYFFTINKIKNKEVKLVYCPTEKMVTSFNSNLLQGKLFVDFRNTITGIKFEVYDRYKKMYEDILKQYNLFENEDDLYHICHSSKECIGILTLAT